MCPRVGDATRDTPGIQLLGDRDGDGEVCVSQTPELYTRQVDDHLLQAGKALEDQPEGCQGEHIGGGGHMELLHLFQPERERESENKKLPPKLTNLVMEDMLSTLGLCRCSGSR